MLKYSYNPKSLKLITQSLIIQSSDNLVQISDYFIPSIDYIEIQNNL